MIRENIETVRENIRKAAERAGRNPGHHRYRRKPCSGNNGKV